MGSTLESGIRLSCRLPVTGTVLHEAASNAINSQPQKGRYLLFMLTPWLSHVLNGFRQVP